MWLSSTTAKRDPLTKTKPNITGSSRSSSSSRPTSPGATLAEALRKNPFRSPTKEGLVRKDARNDIDGTVSLNRDLQTLANLFPNVQYDVFREVLRRFDGDSRLPISTEQLLKYKTEWARGRLQNPPRELDQVIPVQEQFRTKDYTEAVQRTLALEFRSVGKSAINAVLAEQNQSYIKARPVLQEIASRPRWNVFINLFGYRKKKDGDEIPTALLERGKGDNFPAQLIFTKSPDLDAEMQELFFTAPARRITTEQLKTDSDLAQVLNEEQARETQALYECQVCYNETTFEQISTCTSEGHVICMDCVRRTLHEAIFGQGWSKSIDSSFGTLRCPASTTDECNGHIPQPLLKRAVLDQQSGNETWIRLEERLADDALHRSGLSLTRCPFCFYAEVNQNYTLTSSTSSSTTSKASSSSITWHIRKPTSVTISVFLLNLILLTTLLILVLHPILLLLLPTPTSFTTLFTTSLTRLALLQRTTRFACLNPRCARKSCLLCSKPWHDPHICHEPLILSLRTTVEAARTAAVKRTCPRCGTSFVKASGCNKLTCVCGYAMCYLCRANISSKSTFGLDNRGLAAAAAVGAGAGGGGAAEAAEGYRHFCEHFRPNPGMKCTECDKCDLYKNEDEDVQVRRAGEEAERLWREKEGIVVGAVGVKALDDVVAGINSSHGSTTGGVMGINSTVLLVLWNNVWNGKWSLQSFVDGVVEKVIVVDVT